MSRSSRCVFVGNIPYETTEQQLIEIFSEVGPVVSFRLVFDRERGKPKGYGFCEFRDAETALSAMRNLNNYEINGRNLRVDFAENEKQSAGGGPGDTEYRAPNQPTREAPSSMTTSNQDFQTEQPTVEQVLQTVTQTQLYDVMSNMKLMVQQDPETALKILLSNPPLAYAILQAQVILGMVNPNQVQQLLQQSTQPTPPVVPQQQPPAIPQQQPTQQDPRMFQAPPRTAATQPTPQPTEQEILLQVMSLTPAQIALLPPDQQAQVQQLRALYMQK